MPRQDGTQRDATPALSPKQELAVSAIVAGRPFVEIAEEIGVDRTTVYRWTRDDYDFIAEVNSRRLQLRRAHDTQLMSLARSAIEVVEHALDAQDVKTALAVLKGLGFLGGSETRIGETDPRRLEQAAVEERRREESERRMGDYLDELDRMMYPSSGS